MKILILEDNSVLQKSLHSFLTPQGWEVVLASSYEDALKLIKEGSFDLYIIDVLLPDNKGYELLKRFNKKSESRFILISGLFDASSISKHIPNELQDLCFFMKKPIDLKNLLEQIHKINKGNESKSTSSRKNPASETLRSFLSKFKTFDVQELILILFLAFRSKFSGILEFHLNNKQKHLIEFTNGFINKVISEDVESYFGNLLVEHGLSMQEDIQKILEDDEEKKYLGEYLVEKSLLSPHMLDFILKEQIKLRLTKIMSHLSFSVTISKKEEEQEENPDAVPEFNEQDLMTWASDSLQTKIKDTFLKSFYMKNKYNYLKANHNIQQNIFDNKPFIEKYSILYKKIKKNITFEEFFKNSKTLEEDLKFVYFGILTQSIDIIILAKSGETHKKTEEIINHILQNKMDNLFQVLSIPWKSSKSEVERSYKELTKMVHPDKIPANSSKKVADKYNQAFHKIQESYRILSNTHEREIYLKNQEGESFLNILSTYEKGTTLVKADRPEAGLNLLKTIETNSHAPNNISLYILWAKIKLAGDISNNKQKAGSLKQEIEKFPMDQRISPLFWFVAGLYYKNIRNYEKAITLFKKTIQLQKNFREAHQEIIATRTQMKEDLKKQKNNNNVFSRFLNKKSG